MPVLLYCKSMALARNQIILIGLGVVVVIGLVVLIIFGVKQPQSELSGNLTFWGVFDNSSVIDNAIQSYKKIHPKVEISYRQLNADTYETDLINALAGENPPDILMFHNAWLPKHFNKVAPFSENQIVLKDFKSLFPTVVEQDFAPDGVIYALPLYIDTLAFFYNQDIFDNKGVALPPKNWTEFENLAPKLRALDKTGRITKPAAAIGGSNKSVNRGTDLLNLLMLQTGTKMTRDDFSAATFNSDEGLNATLFYTKFANAASPLYTWNDSLPYSLDSFASGETAMMFNYSYQLGFLKEKNPFLKFGVSPMLQPENASQAVNYANYWGLAASAKGRNRAAAQDFILFMTTNPSISQKYLKSTGKPPALRSLINGYLTDPDLGIFARQALTARSWPQVDSAATETIFSQMIESIITGKLSADRALSEAEDKVTQLMERRIR